jgi:parallel beta-helix repeat protein
MRTRLGLLCAAIVAALVWFVWSEGQALGATLHCGDVITHDTVLDNDLFDCSKDGIVIGADGITLDLNGHTISGAFLQPEDWQYSPGAGVLNRGYANVTIENGVIGQFAQGADFRGLPTQASMDDHSTVRGLTVGRSIDGILVSGNQSLVEDNTISAPEGGINVTGSGNVLAGNTGVIFVSGSTNLVEHNVGAITTSGNHNVIRDNADVWVLDLSGHGNIVKNNTSEERRGIWLIRWADHSQIKGNSLLGNPFGGMLFFQATDNLVARNRVIDPGEGGIAMTGGSDRNEIVRNEVSGATNAGDRITIGAGLDGSGIGIADSHDNRIERNTVVGNTADGIAVNSASTRTAITRNRASRNGDDGIHVENPYSTLTANSAFLNGDLGIEAVSGVIDGGHNRAFDNGNPLQCLNVSCKGKGWKN